MFFFIESFLYCKKYIRTLLRVNYDQKLKKNFMYFQKISYLIFFRALKYMTSLIDNCLFKKNETLFITRFVKQINCSSKFQK